MAGKLMKVVRRNIRQIRRWAIVAVILAVVLYLVLSKHIVFSAATPTTPAHVIVAAAPVAAVPAAPAAPVAAPVEEGWFHRITSDIRAML